MEVIEAPARPVEGADTSHKCQSCQRGDLVARNTLLTASLQGEPDSTVDWG